MKTTQFETLAKLRAVIGYLGEREQYAWWQSAFFASGSKAFLAPVFVRTQFLAQFTGVTRAAALIHDERIGIGQVYHLFRLPEDVEQGIHRLLCELTMRDRISTLITGKDNALRFLREEAESNGRPSIGPTRIGAVKDLRRRRFWAMVAGCYLCGFDSDQEVYPYFADTV